MVKERHPTIANEMMVGIDREEGPCFQSVRRCQQLLVEAGLVVPPWSELVNTPRAELEPEPNQPKFGWQQRAARQLHEQSREQVRRILTNTERAMLRSQHGPLASAVFTALPTSRVTKIESQPFRLLLCRRLRLPIPVSSRTCRCGRRLDHHRAGCSGAGVWRGGGSPSRSLLHRYAGKRERGCPRTSSFVI